ncbi:MAG: sugar ABC transporter permease [Firmicutes bacterium]|nr:sugar ABC transporter permease [Bacillota bacterium]
MSVDNRLWRKKQLRWFGAGFHRRDRLLGFLLFLPVLVWISAVVLYPMVVSVLLSFQNARFTAAGASWVGLRNYSRILADRNFWTIARNTLTWTVGNYAVQMGAGLAVALLLNQRFKGASVLRTWIIVPWVIPTVAMCIMWIWMLNASVGVINHIFLRIGLLSERMSFLGTPTTAMLTTILLNSWRWFPLITVVLLAAMQSVPEELYEAAEVDGASVPRKFWHITLPWIQPTMKVLSLLVLIWIYNSFIVIWLTTQGGPGNRTMILPVLVYHRAFQIFRLSEGAAISVLMFIILVILALFYLRYVRMEKSQ